MTHPLSCWTTALLIGATLAAGSIAYGSEYGKGKALYQDKCLICHGANGKGDGPAAAAFTPPPADFSRPSFWQQENVERTITQTVENGKGAMPAFDLTGEEIRAIVDYMAQAFKK